MTRRQDFSPIDRAVELLADEAAVGLSPEQTRELDGLLREASESGRDEIMEVAALVQLSFLKEDRAHYRPMPESLRETVSKQAAEFFAAKQHNKQFTAPVSDIGAARERRAVGSASRAWYASPILGWAVAASLALIVVLLSTGVGPGGADMHSAALDRASLIDQPGTIVVDWKAADQQEFRSVSGDVVWNQELQSGYLRLAGMPVNDPAKRQYQLWIVDPERDANPIDGGVFDIPAGTDEVIVRIDPKLAVRSPEVFAITAEQPGGVVVSAGPLLVVAPVTG